VESRRWNGPCASYMRCRASASRLRAVRLVVADRRSRRFRDPYHGAAPRELLAQRLLQTAGDPDGRRAVGRSAGGESRLVRQPPRATRSPGLIASAKPLPDEAQDLGRPSSSGPELVVESALSGRGVDDRTANRRAARQSAPPGWRQRWSGWQTRQRSVLAGFSSLPPGQRRAR